MSELILRSCNHSIPCLCPRLVFRVRPLACTKDPQSECYGYPLAFDPDYWIDTLWGRLFRFRCSSCGYANHVDQSFMGRPEVRQVA